MPLTRLTRKENPFEWSEECEKSFQTLKECLTTAPVLALPTEGGGYEVYTDASGIGLGCVLMQHGKVIAYASRQLKKHEENYPVHDLELAAVIFALKIWRHYLYGEQFTVFSDHKSLKYLFSQKELNMRQRRWLEYLKDFDFSIQYHPGKGNVVADALSRKPMAMLSNIMIHEWHMLAEFAELSLNVEEKGEKILMFNMSLHPTIVSDIKEQQKNDPMLVEVKENLAQKHDFNLAADGRLLFQGRTCVPDYAEIKKTILNEAHRSKYTIHPGAAKMYQDLKRNFWWPNMKREIADFVAHCLTCQQVKAEHQKPAGKLKPLEIPEWKWEHIGMDFIMGLPKTKNGMDAIWVIVDRLTKSAHFLSIKSKWTVDVLAALYIKEVVRLHGIPVSITSDRDPRFTSHFWKSLQTAIGTRLNFSTAFHPQTDGQTERTNQIIEDMLRACMIDFAGSWQEHLALIEFAYNNSYQSSIQMAPFEALYGRSCRSPICWEEVGDRQLLGPEIV